VKEFRKSINISLSYAQKNFGVFFMPHSVYKNAICEGLQQMNDLQGHSWSSELLLFIGSISLGNVREGERDYS